MITSSSPIAPLYSLVFYFYPLQILRKWLQPPFYLIFFITFQVGISVGQTLKLRVFSTQQITNLFQMVGLQILNKFCFIVQVNLALKYENRNLKISLIFLSSYISLSRLLILRLISFIISVISIPLLFWDHLFRLPNLLFQFQLYQIQLDTSMRTDFYDTSPL